MPPATPSGTYRVEVLGRGPEGQDHTISVELKVDGVTIPRAATGRAPVVLLNGFQLFCTDSSSSLAASQDTFGQLASLLQADQASVSFFNNCAYGDISIEQLLRPTTRVRECSAASRWYVCTFFKHLIPAVVVGITIVSDRDLG